VRATAAIASAHNGGASSAAIGAASNQEPSDNERALHSARRAPKYTAEHAGVAANDNSEKPEEAGHRDGRGVAGDQSKNRRTGNTTDVEREKRRIEDARDRVQRNRQGDTEHDGSRKFCPRNRARADRQWSENRGVAGFERQCVPHQQSRQRADGD
jgi:hypothetical protein